MAKTYEERVNELQQKIEQMENLRKDLLQKQKAEDRKARTHRLIQLGAAIEQAAGEEVDPAILAAYLQTVVRRDTEGNAVRVIDLQKEYYKRAVDRMQEQGEQQ